MITNSLVSFCIFAYNQEEYIKKSVQSALRQTYSPLEIIISDDCSTDKTFQIIEEVTALYNGPHTVIINRNESNVGLGGHFSEVCDKCSGKYIVVLGGDDISIESHVQRAVGFIEENPDVMMVDFNGTIIDSEGTEAGVYQHLTFDKMKFFLSDYLKFKSISSFAPGRIFSKALISEFNPISNNCPTEDSVLVLRSLLLGGMLRVNENLVFYRIHGNNISSANNLRKISNLAIISQYYIDALKFFNDKKLGEQKCYLLLQRINLEYQIRESTYTQSKNRLMFLMKRIYLKWLKILLSNRS